jgi:hypothetical protein
MVENQLGLVLIFGPFSAEDFENLGAPAELILGINRAGSAKCLCHGNMVSNNLLILRWIRILSDEELEKKDCGKAETSVAIFWLASLAPDSGGVFYTDGAVSDGPCANVDYSQCYVSRRPQ